jgi:hypothetical protein
MNVNGLPEPFRTCGGGGSRPQSVRSTTTESCSVTRNRNSGAGTPQFQSLAGGGSAYIRNNQVNHLLQKLIRLAKINCLKDMSPIVLLPVFTLLYRPEETKSHRKQPIENLSPVLLTLARNQNPYIISLEYLKN